tara:strand:- start:46315 stop:48111 length:1797 start_codon:yes stop_codon:yes gene_type:complete
MVGVGRGKHSRKGMAAMNVSMLFPPSICLPNQVYYSLPLFAAVLARAGHTAYTADLNLIAADMLLDRDMADTMHEVAIARLVTPKEVSNPALAAATRSQLESSFASARRGEDFKKTLRDPHSFYDQRQFHDAFWGIVDVLGAYYQLDPVISPFRATFAADMRANQEADAWTPMLELYDRGLLDESLAGSPDVIGVSIAFPEQAVEAIRLLRKLREHAPDVKLVVGGPLISGFVDRWFEDDLLLDYCDYVVLGDGETAFVELLEAIEGKRAFGDVRNLAWRDAEGIVHRPTAPYFLEALDDLPVPDFDAVDMARYFLPEPIYPVMLSRGCYWGKCTFCSIGWRENYRMASEEKIREDIAAISERFGARFLQLQDSSVPPKAARYLSTAIRDLQLDMHWVSNMKFEKVLMDREYCEHLGGAGGCRSLHLGFESADQRLLDLMAKGYNFADLPEMLENMQHGGISAEMLWFIGFPSQTRQDILDTAMFLQEHSDRFGLSSFVGDYFLHPDTEVFERPEDFGVTVRGIDNDHCQYDVSSGVTQEEATALKGMLSGNNNRTLVCNGSHLPHLAVTGHLRELARPMHVTDAVRTFCTSEDGSES